MSQPNTNEYVNAAYVKSVSDESMAQIDSALEITSENTNNTVTDDNDAATKSSLSSFSDVNLSDSATADGIKNKENTSAEEEDDEVPGLPQYPLPGPAIKASRVTHDKTILESTNLGKIININKFKFFYSYKCCQIYRSGDQK